jgi:hypothetical protein
MVAVFFNGVSESADMNIHGPGFDKSFIPPYGIKQLIAIEHPSRSLHKKTQKLDFFGTHLCRPSTDKHLIGTQIQSDIP